MKLRSIECGPNAYATFGIYTDNAVRANYIWASWLLFILFLAVAAFGMWLYRSERTELNGLRYVPAVMRLLLIALVCLALLDWSRFGVEKQKPDLLVLLDGSQSSSHIDNYQESEWIQRQQTIAINKGSAIELNRMQLAIQTLTDNNDKLLLELQKRFNVKLSVIGDSQIQYSINDGSLDQLFGQVQPDQPASRLGDFLIQSISRQRGQSTAAIVLMSDGVVTSGQSFEQAAIVASNFEIPVFTVGLGTDKPTVDVELELLRSDDAVFVGDNVTFDVQIKGVQIEKQLLRVVLTETGQSQPLNIKTVVVDREQFNRKIQLTTRPDRSGLINYTVKVNDVAGETNLRNNSVSKSVLVRNDSINVLLVYGYPGFEYRFLKHLLGRQSSLFGSLGKSIQLTSVLQSADPEGINSDDTAARVFPVDRQQLDEFDVVIVGDVRFGGGLDGGVGEYELELLRDYVVESGGSLVFVSGPRWMPTEFFDSPIGSLFPMAKDAIRNAQLVKTNQSARLVPTQLGMQLAPFRISDTEETILEQFAELPQLLWRVETESLKQGALVLATADDDPKQPLVTLQHIGRGRVVFHFYDESYRWRFRRSDRIFGHYWVQMLRFLSQSDSEQATQVELSTDRQRYNSNDQIGVTLQFHDENARPDAEMVTINLSGQGEFIKQLQLNRNPLISTVYNTTFETPGMGGYELEYGSPISPTARISFQVEESNIELENLQLNAADLSKLSASTGGQFYNIWNAQELFDDLPEGTAIDLGELPAKSLWNWWPFPFVFALLFIALLSTEWILRKKFRMI